MQRLVSLPSAGIGNMPESSNTCRLVTYSGRVQGVGFRWTTARISRRHAVSGHVRNMPDGTVRLLAQGNDDSVRAFLEEVAEALSARIERVEETETACQDDLAGFEILR